MVEVTNEKMNEALGMLNEICRKCDKRNVDEFDLSDIQSLAIFVKAAITGKQLIDVQYYNRD